METVIILNGAPRSGKDTFCDICHEEAQCAVGYTSMIHAAQEVTNFINKTFGTFLYSNKKDKKKRKFLYELKKALDIYSISLNNVIDDYCAFTHNADISGELDKLYIIHARELIDINKLKFIFSEKTYPLERAKIFTVFVNRNEVEEAYENPADDNVYNCKYDYIIENNGTLEEYKESIRTFLNEIGVKLI